MTEGRLPLETQFRLAQVRDQAKRMPREVLEGQFVAACEALLWRDILQREVMAQLHKLQEVLGGT